jgi:hypothetical protein
VVARTAKMLNFMMTNLYRKGVRRNIEGGNGYVYRTRIDKIRL